MNWLQGLVRIIVALVVKHKAGGGDETKGHLEGRAVQTRGGWSYISLPTVSL